MSASNGKIDSVWRISALPFEVRSGVLPVVLSLEFVIDSKQAQTSLIVEVSQI